MTIGPILFIPDGMQLPKMSSVCSRLVLNSSVFFAGACTLVAPWASADAPAIPAGTGSPAAAQAAAQAATGAAAAAPVAAQTQPSTWGMLMPMIIMFAVVYFMMIRPQQKKMKEHQKMLEAVKSGDEVVTASGILGRVAGINERVVTLEVASNVHVKMLKSQISQVVKGQVKELA